MKIPLDDLLRGRRLSSSESGELLIELLREPVNGSLLAAFLSILRMRGVSVDELDGFSRALLSIARPLDFTPFEVLDVCGTGGDSKGTFNISTTVAFVLAGAGYKVAKHGNYGVSSGCGSSDVLEALGVRFTTDPARLLRSLEYAGVCFLHAPSFHPALRAAAPVRRELGVRTVFNMLGPLVNPARPAFQMNGVYDREVLRLYGYLLKRRGAKFAVLHSLDGCDEVSLAAPTEVIWHTGRCVIHAEDFKLPTVKPAELRAPGSQQGSAALLRAVLTNDGPPAHQAVVLANAAVAIWCHNGSSNTKQLPECVEIAREALTSGAAAEALRRSIENTNAE